MTTTMAPALHLDDLIRPADLEAARTDRLVAVRHTSDLSGGAGLRILNYTDAATYTRGAWDNPAVRLCRGLIIDGDGMVVARSWEKFFNHNQAEAGVLPLDAPVEVTDKKDGSLGIVFRGVDGEPRVATRGSFESEQAFHATEILRRDFADIDLDAGVTPLVEIVYPANRIVLTYGEMDTLILLGGVVTATGEYLGPSQARDRIGWTGPVTETFSHASLRDALAADPRPNAEGLCVRFTGERGLIVKVKQADYVALHKVVTGLNERVVWEHMVSARPLEELLAPLPDELHAWTRGVWDGLAAQARGMEAGAQDLHREVLSSLPDGWDRRAFADAAKAATRETPGVLPLLFQMLDGRDVTATILRSLRPAGDQRAVVRDESVA